MYICDDDLIVYKTLNKSIKFLSKNLDYSAVGGLNLSCILNDNQEILNFFKNPIESIEHNSSYDRVKNLINNYFVTNYTVARTADFKERFSKQKDYYDKSLGTEEIPCYLICAQGKIKIFEDLFVIRQIHNRRIINPEIKLISKNLDWKNTFDEFIEILSKKVSEKDKLDYLEISKNLRFLLSNSFNILDQKKSDNNNFIYLFLLKLFDKNIKSKIKFILYKYLGIKRYKYTEEFLNSDSFMNNKEFNFLMKHIKTKY